MHVFKPMCFGNSYQTLADNNTRTEAMLPFGQLIKNTDVTPCSFLS